MRLYQCKRSIWAGSQYEGAVAVKDVQAIVAGIQMHASRLPCSCGYGSNEDDNQTASTS